MKAALAAIALTTLAVAAPVSNAHASEVMIRVDTPQFGIRIGTPVRIYAPAPVYSPRVYVPAPVYAAPVPVVYAPSRLIVQPVPGYPIVAPYPYRPGPKHYWKAKHRHHRDEAFRGYRYGDRFPGDRHDRY